MDRAPCASDVCQRQRLSPLTSHPSRPHTYPWSPPFHVWHQCYASVARDKPVAFSVVQMLACVATAPLRMAGFLSTAAPYLPSAPPSAVSLWTHQILLQNAKEHGIASLFRGSTALVTVMGVDAYLFASGMGNLTRCVTLASHGLPAWSRIGTLIETALAHLVIIAPTVRRCVRLAGFPLVSAFACQSIDPGYRMFQGPTDCLEKVRTLLASFLRRDTSGWEQGFVRPGVEGFPTRNHRVSRAFRLAGCHTCGSHGVFASPADACTDPRSFRVVGLAGRTCGHGGVQPGRAVSRRDVQIAGVQPGRFHRGPTEARPPVLRPDTEHCRGGSFPATAAHPGHRAADITRAPGRLRAAYPSCGGSRRLLSRMGFHAAVRVCVSDCVSRRLQRGTSSTRHFLAPRFQPTRAAEGCTVCYLPRMISKGEGCWQRCASVTSVTLWARCPSTVGWFAHCCPHMMGTPSSACPR